MTADPTGEKWSLALRIVHGDSARFAWEAARLHGHGYELVEVIGLDRLIWRKDDRYYTTEYAMARIEKEEG